MSKENEAHVGVSGIIEFTVIPETLQLSKFKDFDPKVKASLEDKLLRIESTYSCHTIIAYLKEYIFNNLDSIYGAHIEFYNWVDDIIPAQITFDVWDGLFYDQIIRKVVPLNWWYSKQPLSEDDYSLDDITIEPNVVE